MSNNRRRALLGAAIGVCAAVAVSAIAMIAHEIGRYKESQSIYTELAELADMAGSDDESEDPNTVQQALVDFDALREINPDVVGWLICEGTEINYPVVQGEDDVYYLNHHFDGTPGKAGCLFVDSDNMPGDENLIVYGHNLLDGSMFSTLTEYADQGYYEEFPELLLLTPEGNYTVEVFSAYTASTGDECWKVRFEAPQEYRGWIQTAYERSNIETPVAVNTDDRVLTLSTCTSGGRARFVVHGRLVPFSLE